MGVRKFNTAEYRCWIRIRQRCNNQNHHKYPAYGGRGIKVCPSWDSFDNFLADMGERPHGYTIDRIDNDGDYCPENCRWTTPQHQQRNTRANRKITWNGQTLCVSEWSEITGIPRSAIQKRLDRNWTIHDTLTKPSDRRVQQRNRSKAADSS